MNIGNVAHMMIKCVKVASFRVVSRTTVISYLCCSVQVAEVNQLDMVRAKITLMLVAAMSF